MKSRWRESGFSLYDSLNSSVSMNVVINTGGEDPFSIPALKGRNDYLRLQVKAMKSSSLKSSCSTAELMLPVGGSAPTVCAAGLPPLHPCSPWRPEHPEPIGCCRKWA